MFCANFPIRFNDCILSDSLGVYKKCVLYTLLFYGCSSPISSSTIYECTYRLWNCNLNTKIEKKNQNAFNLALI